MLNILIYLLTNYKYIYHIADYVSILSIFVPAIVLNNVLNFNFMFKFSPNCSFERLICNPQTYVALMHCGVLLRDAYNDEMALFGCKFIEFLKSENVSIKDKF